MKRIFAVVFVLIVLTAFTPLWGSASEAATDLTCSYLNDKSGVLDAGEYRLTNEDPCTYNGKITFDGDVTLDLNGNSLVSKDGISCSSSSCSLTITDNTAGNTGTLTVRSDIYILGRLEISGGTVNASSDGHGIYAYGDINISGKSTVTATGTRTFGIYGYGSIAISGTVEKASGGQYGIYAGGIITIESGGKVTEASGGEDGSGIYAGGIITIESGGKVTEASGDDYGIYGYGSIAISGTVEKASGGQYGIYAGGGITIESGGKVTEASGGEDGSGIYADGINISGTVTEATGGKYGIYAGSHIDINESGTVTEASGGQYGIYAGDIITIESGTVKASGTNVTGIYADNYIYIFEGGTVRATGGKYGIYAGSHIDINKSGTVTATGGTYGIHSGPEGIFISGENTKVTAESTDTSNSDSSAGIYSSGKIDIQGGTVTAKGETQAVSGSVKNAVPGIGWEDAAGTQGPYGIPESESGQSLSFRKVRFPVPYDITPEPEPERPGIDFFRLHTDCGLPATGFSALRPTVLPEQPKDLRYEPVRMHLMLPTLDRDVELVTMPREGNSWAAAWLGADAGILEGSALPGEGLSVIAGHNTLNDTDCGPFALLSTLEVNDTVMVREESGALKLFRVYANELLEPDDMERLSALAGEDALVLLTCENESPSGGYLHRRAVFAK